MYNDAVQRVLNRKLKYGVKKDAVAKDEENALMTLAQSFQTDAEQHVMKK